MCALPLNSPPAEVCCALAGWFTCALGVILSSGVAEGLSVCGNFGPNFAACYTCHSREKIRRCASPSKPHCPIPVCFSILPLL